MDGMLGLASGVMIAASFWSRLAPAIDMSGGDWKPATVVHGSVRFSFSRYNSEGDVDRIIEVFPQIVANQRKLSPYWDNNKNTPRPDAEDVFRHAR